MVCPSQEKRIREMSNPEADLMAIFAKEKDKIGKDNPILVSEGMYDTAIRIVKENNIAVKIEPVKAVWKETVEL